MKSSIKKADKKDAPHPLQACVEILAQLGESGKIVWQTSKDIKDPVDRLAYLVKAIQQMRERAKTQAGMFTTLPVDVRTFVESERMLNMPGEVYPKVLSEIEEMCSGKYVEAVLTGGIGTGKTTAALIVIAYTLYELSCMVNPHKAFGLAVSSEIVFIFQSLKKELSRDVDYKRFKAMIDNSPYFQEMYPYDKGIESEMQFPRRVIVKPLTGATTAAIGQNVFGGVIDEVNFMAVIENSKAADDGGTFDQAREVYNSIARRRQSRFLNQGRLPGMLCLVSSKRYPGEFTDRKMEEAKHDPTIYIYDKRVWDVKPEGTFSGKWFKVFQGDTTRKPRIIDPSEEALLSTWPEDDLRLVIDVPEEYRGAFRDDLYSAIRDIAGCATMALHPFILDTTAIGKAFGVVKSIGSRPDVDFVSSKLQLYPRRINLPEEPRFAHIDLAVSRDSCGLSIGHVVGFEPMSRGANIEMLPVIRFDLILEIRPPRGGEIELENARRVLYACRKAGMNLKWVSLDTYQSKDSLQILAKQGFIVGTQSMDTDTVAYDVSKQALYDGRVLAPESAKAKLEWARLERDPKTKKIDHPPKGSKDVSDSMAGVIYGLTMRREIWSRHGISLRSIPPTLLDREQGGKTNIRYMEVLRQERYGS